MSCPGSAKAGAAIAIIAAITNAAVINTKMRFISNTLSV
jgi:hypothetical protein